MHSPAELTAVIPDIGILGMADGDDMDIAGADHLHQAAAIGAVDADNGDPAITKQGGEQPCIGQKIRFHIGVVIEMIAAEMREPGDMDTNTVKPVLLKPVG